MLHFMASFHHDYIVLICHLLKLENVLTIKKIYINLSGVAFSLMCSELNCICLVSVNH